MSRADSARSIFGRYLSLYSLLLGRTLAIRLRDLAIELEDGRWYREESKDMATTIREGALTRR